MSKIRILPEQLANQIAAGEVVERPASVVKELLENSLDAKASRIEIEVEGAGTRMLRIIDNGEGMDEDDLLMSLERHGTSKIAREEDLGAIGTLGFRGEAIPSIGSVSQLTITSRPKTLELGTRVVLHYGKLTKVHETGCSFGTTIEVRNLFGNTPARRKFLRTGRTELGHIDEVVKNYGLGSPKVTFILRIDGRETIYLDNSLSVEQRLGSILRHQGPFIPIDQTLPGDKFHRAWGFLVPPEKVTVGPSKMRLFVNGRAIRDRMMIHAVTEGLRGFLMKGKNPSGLVHLVLPAEEVDVNVHPAKHEVRFRNSRDVHALLSLAVTEAMRNYQREMKTAIFGKEQLPEKTPVPSEISSFATHQFSPPSLVNKTDTAHSYEGDLRTHTNAGQQEEKVLKTKKSQPAPMNSSGESPSTQPLFVTAEPIHNLSSTKSNHTSLDEMSISNDEQVHHNLIVIGQFDNLYIFCKNSDGLLVIDQHAAHERLLYEKLRDQYLNKSIARQTLMFPETVELSLFQAQLVDKNEQEIDRIGFTLREFGGNSYIISAIPALAGTSNPRDLFLDILEQFGSESGKGHGGGLLDTILATMACKAAVKAGTALSLQEIDKLLNEMAKADLFSHCPHGRPVIKQFSKDDVKKWFYRT